MKTPLEPLAKTTNANHTPKKFQFALWLQFEITDR
jgi:hypothetical protein